VARGDVTVKLPTLDQVIPPAQRKALLAHLAALAVGRIKRRTGAGLDVNGKAFKPYSFGYATMRHQAGRTVSPVQLTMTGAMLASMQVLSSDANRAVIGFQGSSAAVRFTRRMRTRVVRNALSSSRETVAAPITNKKTGQKITHTFAEQNRQVANALKAYWNDKGEGSDGWGTPRRHFFGLSADDRSFLSRTALRELVRMAGQVFLRRALGKR
jgi:hypothetical protein